MLKERCALDSMKPTKDLGPERVGLKPRRGWGDICRFKDTFLGNIRSRCRMPNAELVPTHSVR